MKQLKRKQKQREKKASPDKRKKSFAVWWKAPTKWLRFKPPKKKSTKCIRLTFTAGRDWIIGMFFLRSQAMDEEMLIRIHFPQRLSWPALNLLASPPSLQSPLQFLSTFSCHIFLFLCFSLFCFCSVCLVNRQNFNHTLVEILTWQWRFLHEN